MNLRMAQPAPADLQGRLQQRLDQYGRRRLLLWLFALGCDALILGLIGLGGSLLLATRFDATTPMLLAGLGGWGLAIVLMTLRRWRQERRHWHHARLFARLDQLAQAHGRLQVGLELATSLPSPGSLPAPDLCLWQKKLTALASRDAWRLLQTLPAARVFPLEAPLVARGGLVLALLFLTLGWAGPRFFLPGAAPDPPTAAAGETQSSVPDIQVALLAPGQESQADPQSIVHLEIALDAAGEAIDTQLLLTLNDQPLAPLALPILQNPGMSGSLLLRQELPLASLGVRPGDTLTILAQASRRDAAGTPAVRSRAGRIHIVSGQAQENLDNSAAQNTKDISRIPSAWRQTADPAPDSNKSGDSSGSYGGGNSGGDGSGEEGGILSHLTGADRLAGGSPGRVLERPSSAQGRLAMAVSASPPLAVQAVALAEIPPRYRQATEAYLLRLSRHPAPPPAVSTPGNVPGNAPGSVPGYVLEGN